MSFVALGFLRKDVSRRRQQWDEAQLRHVARSLGFDFSRTITFSHLTRDPVRQLLDAVVRLDVDAVVVPSLSHFTDHVIPAALLEITDVITVAPEHIYTQCAPAELSRTAIR
ncbi:hypothetical protein [Nocardia nova]|uniref:Uncharacterized protein n=1 Tax=Nocardia nova SH22a TaxID=1415166 RepID=W5TG28_9NOCA|nr:hypothetical protein [Nocardia nova]AHH17923.1 hypothetical protein NONO_c31360 [Nocardia nova SH22a]